MPTYTYSFHGLVQQLTNLTAAPSCLIKDDLFLPVLFFLWTLLSLTSLLYLYSPIIIWELLSLYRLLSIFVVSFFVVIKKENYAIKKKKKK